MSAVDPDKSASSRARIRLVVVADVRLYRDGLAAALGRFDHLIVAGVAGDAAEAVRLVQQAVPDVAIVDISLDGGLGLFRELRALALTTKVIAFGVYDDSAAIIRCAEAGAAGYVTLNASIDDLAAAIERAADGELECAPRVAAELFRRLAGRTDPRPPAAPGGDGLTRREHEVLALLARGLSNKEIAGSLHIAEATVKNHVHNLLEKLNVATRAQAAACAHDDLLRHRQALPRRALAARN